MPMCRAFSRSAAEAAALTTSRFGCVVTLNPLDRIAQMIIVPVLQVGFNIVDDFDASHRGEGGFGSTGHG